MHTMELIRTTESTEEWYCPTCERRVSIQWKPFKRTILNQGDVFAAHHGSRGGLTLGASPVMQDDMSDGMQPADDPWLEPWVRWANDFDWSHHQNDED